MGKALDAVERLMTTYDRKDPAGVVHLYAEGAAITRPGGGTMDRDALARFFGVFVQAMPNFTHELTFVMEDGPVAAYEAVLTATFTGELQSPNGPVPPTGNPLRLSQAGFITVDDEGMIVRDVSYLDQVDMLGQLGLLPSPVGA